MRLFRAFLPATGLDGAGHRQYPISVEAGVDVGAAVTGATAVAVAVGAESGEAAGSLPVARLGLPPHRRWPAPAGS